MLLIELCPKTAYIAVVDAVVDVVKPVFRHHLDEGNVSKNRIMSRSAKMQK